MLGGGAIRAGGGEEAKEKEEEGMASALEGDTARGVERWLGC